MAEGTASAHCHADSSAKVESLTAVCRKNGAQIFESCYILQRSPLALHFWFLFLRFLDFIGFYLAVRARTLEVLHVWSVSALVSVYFGASGASALFITILAARFPGPAVVVESILLAEVLHFFRWHITVRLPRVLVRPIALPAYAVKPSRSGLHRLLDAFHNVSVLPLTFPLVAFDSVCIQEDFLAPRVLALKFADFLRLRCRRC